MDIYEALALQYPGWTYNEIRALSFRERINWINKAIDRVRR